MAKAPAFQFYVRDWLVDTSCLPLEAQGAWLNILCHLHLADKRGRDTHSLDQWARLMRTGTTAHSEQVALRIIKQLQSTGVAEVRFRNDRICIGSRRMVREARQRKGWRERAKDRRERGLGPPEHWTALRAQTLLRDKKVCAYCGRRATSVDHVLPRCKGGQDEMTNLVACCSKCNRVKSGRTLQEAEMGFWVGFDQSPLDAILQVTRESRGSPPVSASSFASASAKKKETPPISPLGPTPEATVHFLAVYSEVFPDRIREGNLQLPGWRANGNHKGWQAWADSQPSAVLEAITAKELRAAKAYGLDRNLHFGPGTFDMYRREAKKPARKAAITEHAALVQDFYRQPSAVTRKYLVAHNNDIQQAAEAWKKEQETKA